MSTELIIQSGGERPLYRKLVRDGIEGNYDVLLEMRRLIQSGVSYDIPLEDFIKKLVIADGLDGYSPAIKVLNTVFKFVVSKVKYIQDVAGRIESIKSARQTLSDGFGDCDDQTILNCTLLSDLGFEQVVIAMARYSNNEPTFSHVYCVVYVDGKRYAFDTTLPHAAFDQEVKAVEVKEIPVFGDVPGLTTGLAGAFRQVRLIAGKLSKAGIKALPNAVGVLPLGFAASHALSAGLTLLDQSDSTNYSIAALGSKINKELDEIIVDLKQSRMAFDYAKSQALQLASQFATIEDSERDRESYMFKSVGASVKEKLDFIVNFEQYATDNNITIVYLDPNAMLLTGLILIGGAGYFGYKAYKYARA